MLIKILKSRGPRIDLWGIPLLILAQSLYEEAIFVRRVRKLKESLTKLELY